MPQRNGKHREVPATSETPSINVGDMERIGSGVLGGGLALYGLSRGSVGGLALAAVGGALVYRAVTGKCQVYKALGISTASGRPSHTSIPADEGVRIEEGITVRRPVAEVFHFWRDLENLPKIMDHIESITSIGPKKYHWVVKGPLGHRVEWDAEVHTERENELIGWRSVPGSEVETAGSVHFRPAPDGGTGIYVTLKYNPPAGKVGAAVSRLLGEDPKRQIREDLNHFKLYMETARA
jgi:uncharacterized membrane protein